MRSPSIIIEHPTRGTFREVEHDGDEIKFRFSWSGMRNDPEKCQQFQSEDAALIILNQMPPRIRERCRILRRDPGDIEYRTVG